MVEAESSGLVVAPAGYVEGMDSGSGSWETILVREWTHAVALGEFMPWNGVADFRWCGNCVNENHRQGLYGSQLAGDHAVLLFYLDEVLGGPASWESLRDRQGVGWQRLLSLDIEARGPVGEICCALS